MPAGSWFIRKVVIMKIELEFTQKPIIDEYENDKLRSIFTRVINGTIKESDFIVLFQIGAAFINSTESKTAMEKWREGDGMV